MNPDPSYQELNLKPVRRPQIIDFLPSATTDQVSVNYRRGVVTPTAAPRLENQTLAEFTQTAAKITDPIEAIGSVTTVSIEEYEDDGQFGLVLQEMAADVLRELDEQVLVGTGTSPSLRGITTTASPQTEAYATSRLNTIFVAMMSLMTTERARPNLLVFRPSDWALIHNDIVTSSYSAVQYVQNGLTPLLFGVPVALHEDLTSGVGLVMDPALYAVIYRQGLVVEQTNSNGTGFNNLQLSIRAYVRAALKTRRLGCRLIDLTP
jgi:HK97 family phage major capsid protein